jgi:hypothetical protein
MWDELTEDAEIVGMAAVFGAFAAVLAVGLTLRGNLVIALVSGVIAVLCGAVAFGGVRHVRGAARAARAGRVPAEVRAAVTARVGPAPTGVRVAAACAWGVAAAGALGGAVIVLTAFGRGLLTVALVIFGVVVVLAGVQVHRGAVMLVRDGIPEVMRHALGIVGMLAAICAATSMRTYPLLAAGAAAAALLALAAGLLPGTGAARAWIRARRDLTLAYLRP